MHIHSTQMRVQTDATILKYKIIVSSILYIIQMTYSDDKTNKDKIKILRKIF